MASTKRRAPAGRKKQYDYHNTFKILNRSDRLLRSLDEPDRRIKRADAHQQKIADWTVTQRTNPPGSFWHWWATFRIGWLLRSNPYARTAGDALADAWFEIWMELRVVLWGLGYTVVLVVAYIVWFWFLLFIALPVVWDWFWQLPPGLK